MKTNPYPKILDIATTDYVVVVPGTRQSVPPCSRAIIEYNTLAEAVAKSDANTVVWQRTTDGWTRAELSTEVNAPVRIY